MDNLAVSGGLKRLLQVSSDAAGVFERMPALGLCPAPNRQIQRQTQKVGETGKHKEKFTS